ncbi:pseudouridine synthase [Xanthomonas phaseoli]|uniref:Pseudouridine synthase n=1 Tax=Xanthomonas manihotis TaxID=43353 RepID=A0A8I1XHT6_XANMN|nr:pseudouridine synthase [Xanthomonas phaseoli]KUF37678.1 pseudouridine synthase [Xanthomonas phaseoli pv. manihotis]MBO9722229.1 pseudouridine synthase [Xanthomonas phaseoli pv. manihotis]MBO9756609.1 pseudouridine synthase [Xanthomonas phaseoli pv. manihotis]MBO9758183.1 pseudouridine synthase [Xanthomonas phaseoli pv. manihotis]MBO9762167.1 pseudouridine synthase [Xanthomonas phaseoli pv. manihotis]
MSDTPRKLSLNKLSLKRDSAPEAPKLEERLHKVLAQAGLGSRRALEQRIADGLIKVNGAVAQTGMSVRSGDKIELDGRSFVASALTEPSRVLIYNKPEGEVTTREDPEGRPTVFESLPALKGSRWIAIGRLDINTTGLLLLTTDGELANAMMHPSYEVEREYVVRVRAPEGEEKVSDAIIERLSRGVLLEDGGAKFDEIERIGGTDSHDWFRVVVKEGRNREVRRLWESQGCQVSRLKRSRYGKISLPRELLRGHSVEVAQDKVDALRTELKLEEGAPSALTLQPVIGQRRAAKSTVHVSRDGRSNAYVNGQTSGADEGRELRRFDNLREDRGRGGRGKPGGFRGGLTVSGEAAAKQSQQRPFKQRGPAKGDRGALPDGNPAAFRSWYVPDGVSTGPSGHRNAGPSGPGTGQARPYAKKGPGGARPGAGGPGGARSGGPGRGAGGGQGQSQGQGQRKHPYGHPGNAPSFPSDHANPGFSPYGTARPAGRPSGGRPGPGGNRGPASANRGPGGPGGGGRGPGSPGGAPRGPGGRPPGGGNRRPPGGGNRGR